jgi:HPt (histidine-containing phosphotransfer) domain-containing protein
MTHAEEAVPVLDQAVVDELRATVGGDEEFVLDLVATYVEEARTQVDGLVAAAQANDLAAMVRPAHTLKSSSASVGAMRLASICRDIETAGREGRPDGMVPAVDLVRSTWTETLEALRSAGLAT